MKLHTLMLLLIVLLASRTNPVRAQVIGPPSTEGAPVEVALTIVITKIYGIDTIDETYKIDGYLMANWLDPRLVFDSQEGQSRQLLYENDIASEELGTGIWWPTLEFINIIGEPTLPNKRVIIDENGTVSYNERFVGTFTSDMDFRKFPFDTQYFRIQIESFSYDINEVFFVKPRVFTGDIDESILIEWVIRDQAQPSISSHTYPHHGKTYSRFNLAVKASRKPGYFLWQFFLPLFLIIVTSWVVFWISDFSNQLSTAFTLMLTVVAFNFFTSTLLPRLPYNTFIEIVIISGYVNLFLTIISVLMGHILAVRGKESAGQRLAVNCRWLFPLGYVVSMFLLTVYFLA